MFGNSIGLIVKSSNIDLFAISNGNINAAGSNCIFPTLAVACDIGLLDRNAGVFGSLRSIQFKVAGQGIAQYRICANVQLKAGNLLADALENFRKQLVFEAKELNYTSMDEAFIRKAVDCVNAHLSDCDFEHAQFMAEMGMARTTLADKLKLLTGLTPSAFISNVRLQAACRLIDEKKKIRIADLAYAVGFNDPKYFSSCFKKKFGLSPTEYMMKYDG